MEAKEKEASVCSTSCILTVKYSLKLRELLRPILESVDPSFQYLSFCKNQELKDYHRKACNSVGNEHQSVDTDSGINGKTKQANIKTPAISVVLLLQEKATNNAEKVKRYFKRAPWRFHHKIELSNVRGGKPKVVARQDYYHPGIPGTPLWSVGTVHYGNQYLRYNIFVKDFKAMAHFYCLLTGRKMQYSKPGFCIFVLNTQDGVEVQLALKYSQFLTPVTMEASWLHFDLEDMSILKLFPNLHMTQVSESLFYIKDPDGNGIMLSPQTPSLQSAAAQAVPSANPDPVLNESYNEDSQSQCSLPESHDSGRWSDNADEKDRNRQCNNDAEFLTRSEKCDSNGDEQPHVDNNNTKIGNNMDILPVRF